MNRKILSSQLRRLGNFDVRCVSNGADAVEIMKNAKHGDYAFIIMDYQMPIMDGIQATKNIRQLEQESGRPPIAIVGYTAGLRPWLHSHTVASSHRTRMRRVRFHSLRRTRPFTAHARLERVAHLLSNT